MIEQFVRVPWHRFSTASFLLAFIKKPSKPDKSLQGALSKLLSQSAQLAQTGQLLI
jgi:hypothetical protein